MTCDVDWQRLMRYLTTAQISAENALEKVATNPRNTGSAQVATADAESRHLCVLIDICSTTR
jgi:hypothetical protein